MDFINKLIKKGIFCLILVFGFFVFLSNTNVSAAASDCAISLNGGDKYLVLSTTSRWTDPGVTAECNGLATKNITVTVNNGSAINTTNGAESGINSYLTKSGYYSVQYKITDQNELVYGQTFVTRQIRVLPTNLNNDRILWLGETQYSNSAANDTFNRIIELDDGYLVVGQVDTIGYVAKFNVKGEYQWSWKTNEYSSWENAEVEITDIIESTISTNGVYYIAGSSDGAGFVKPIKITSNIGVDDTYGNLKVFENELDVINRIIMVDVNVYASGYVTGVNAITTGVLLKLTVDTNTGNIESVYEKYQNVEDSKYNALTLSSAGEIVAVGNQAVSQHKGAIGGTITKCDTNAAVFSCETQEPQLYIDNELGNTIVTNFSDVVENNGKYVIVGETRAAKLEGSTTTFNSGLEDLLVVYGSFDMNQFIIEDVQLRGSTSSDAIYSVRKINSSKYIIVGKVASSAYYGFLNIKDNAITVEDNYISGNLYSVFKDVLVKNSQTNNGEVQYVFVGLTKATNLEGMSTNNKGNEEGLFVILDDTSFDNYADISVKKDGSICDDGISKECNGVDVSKDYWLMYGDQKYNFIASVSTTTVKTIYTIHQFTNSQGITFKIGRTIYIVEAPTPSDIILSETGIDKWYVYNRKQVVGDNVSGYAREALWEQYFYPVKDGMPKESNQYYKMDYDRFILDSDTGTTLKNYQLLTPGYELVENGMPKESNQYYKMDGENYVLDTEEGTTLNNYKLVSVEPQATNVAFQSVEKAKEYAFLQEYTRIALVHEQFSDQTGIIGFPGELTKLNDLNYYFIYYIDLTFDKNILDDSNKCETRNFVLVGNCDNYLGYAFASLEKISEIIDVVLAKNNYFVSENSNRYNFTTNLPVTDTFKQELSTVQYLKETQFNVASGLYLDVEFYAVDTSNESKYTFVNVPVSLTNSLKGKSVVRFSNSGDVTGEGKYVVRYCYSETVCGGSATFVIDRTAPVINFIADRGEEKIKGSIVTSWSKENWFKMKGDADITSISDIDPYAYTIVDGKKYYLQCNENVNSQTCIWDREEFILQQYNYDKENPDKIYSIEVYDRAGNKTIVNFKVATGSPTLNIPQTESTTDFTLSIDFYNKNKIDSFEIKYTPSESCGANCTNASDLQNKIFELIQAWNLWNQIELEKAKENIEYTPNIRYSIDIIFSITFDETEGIYKGSATLQQLEYIEVEVNKKVIAGYVPIDGSSDPQVISKGLYEFSITDIFNITMSQSAGLGIEKASLDVFVNDDQWYKDEDILNGDYQIPKTSEEYNVEDQNDGIFKAKAPNTYKEYKEIIVTETLKSSINDDMYFANQFVFVKLKLSAYGITEIRQATSVNYVGKPTANECLILIYGSGITNTNSLNRECTNKVLFDSLGNDSLKDKGIYILGSDGDGKNNYYYLAFASEGVYTVKSKVEVEVTNGEVLALDVDATFVIDYTAPTITLNGYMDTDLNGNCLSGNNGNLCYTNEDFFFVQNENKEIPNIGKHDMIIDLSSEKFNGVLNTEVNRLLMVTINGEMHNAYDYSKVILEINGGEQLIFTDSGQYELVFMDAARNIKIIKFMIDKNAPEIGEFVDVDTNKDVNKYQQYIELEISVTEDTFLQSKDGSVMLTVNYWFDIAEADVKDSDKNPITVQNNNGSCLIALGAISSGRCDATSGSINISFVLAVNKDERETKITRLYVEAYDYFENGKGYVTFKDFSFDNAAPHIYYDTDKYTPTTQFGADVTNEEREKWINVSADATLGNFDCDTNNLASKIIICNDMPEFGKDNDVKIEAYEAYKAANSNFYYNNGYKPLEDGTYLNPQTNIYTARYLDFRSAAELTNKINAGVNIFYHTNYFQVTTNDQIDPNKTYYYGAGKTQVNISDMYKNYATYSTCDGSTPACILYNMYINGESKFTNTDFYYADENKYVWIKNPQTINVADYGNYWYASEGSYEIDTDFSDNYLPAVVLANSKVSYDGGNYLDAPAGAIKLFDEKVKYYNVIEKASTTDSKYITTIAANKYAVLDARTWRIAEEEKFGFGLPSVLGRPIIFLAVDGAGNYSSNQLETVILVKDEIYPTLTEVSTVLYTKDNVNGNYQKVEKYYKVGSIETLECAKSTTTYYKNADGTDSIACEDMIAGQNYFVKVVEYVQINQEDKVDGIDYYVRESNVITNENYLTQKNFSLTFSEPIYRISCSYYDNKDGKTKLCDFSNTEFDYREEKIEFELIHEEMKTYVNYTVTVYDFSNNPTTFNYFFIDREAPVIEFNTEKGNIHEIEVSYNDDVSTPYNESYISNSGYKSELNATDSVNSRIDEVGATSFAKNTLTYDIEYYAYNYNVTYKNYVSNGNTFIPVDDHKLKEEGKNYYILIKKPTDYILKDMNKVCDENYCYVLDEYNYYSNLLDYNPNEGEESHWIKIETNKILKDKVGVYKIVYRATDYSGNVSDTIIKTVYITDHSAPKLNLNDKTTENTYGYHGDVKVSFTGEGEANMIEYTCVQSSLSCQLPAHMFEPATTSLSREPLLSLSKEYTVPGVYKVYAYDKGSYVTTKVSYEGVEYDVMTLKYNYTEYQFVVDKDDPKMYINAYKENDKLYYGVEVINDEVTFNCVSGYVRQDLEFKAIQNCTELLSGNPKITINKNQDQQISSITYELVNKDGETVYQITYTKLAPNAKKFFYNTYYKKLENSDEFENYKIGETYDEDNVYMITYIKLIFREDGSYLIQAQDKALNVAGRYTTEGILEDFSRIDIDNTAPSYNKSMNQPTGVNYWFSVPSEIIDDNNVSVVNNVSKNVTDKSYNLFSTGLNSSFFYAFETYADASAYLTALYKKDISSKSGGIDTFTYRYYDSTQKRMVSRTFNATPQGLTAKEVAANTVIANLGGLIYATFSGEYLFGHSKILQSVCTEADSEHCKGNGNVYKTVYFVNDKYLSETCPKDANTCMEVSVKIIKGNNRDPQKYTISEGIVKNSSGAPIGTYNQNTGELKINDAIYTVKGNNIENNAGVIIGAFDSSSGNVTIGNVLALEMGTINTIDTSKITYYYQSIGGSTTSSSYTLPISLINNTYYLFEEEDIAITYKNYSDNTQNTITHNNKTYYAIFVDGVDKIDVYQEKKQEENSNTTTELIETNVIETNAFEYYLIIKPNNMELDKFKRVYEIHEEWVNGQLTEVYSYLRMYIAYINSNGDGAFYNINDYLVINGNEYYFKVPIDSEKKSEITFTDRAGNETKITVSRTRVAPSINVNYNGSGNDLSVQLSITDTYLAQVDTGEISIEFSTDGTNYSNKNTENILQSLICLPGTNGSDQYGCQNKASANGRNQYIVNIINKEKLYGFFRVKIKDNHGNTNSLEFVYNPMNLDITYETTDIKYISTSVSQDNIRMISKTDLQLKWNNELNYIILYKVVDGELEKICDTYNIGMSSGQCGTKATNKIDVILNPTTRSYEASILYYLEEGIYEAEIINRASEVINARCYDKDGNLKADCEQIKPTNTNSCSPLSMNYCMEKFEIMKKAVTQDAGGITYSKYEIDKTAPSYSIDDFKVEIPSGETTFVNNGTYTNAKVTVKWNEDLVRINYTCEYVYESSGVCLGNFSSYNIKEYTFEVNNKIATKYTFWFEDYAGNETKNNSLTFTIDVALPEIIVYEVTNTGNDTQNIVANNSVINTNARLRCFSNSTLVTCSDVYIVRLYKAVVNGYEEVSTTNPTFVSENFQNTYRFVVSIKAANGYEYTNLTSEIEFTIDKVAPTITVTGNKHEKWGIYKGDVSVMIDSDGTGIIYGECVEIGVDNNSGDKIYECGDPIITGFKHNYKLTETGTYKVIAMDDIGNVTTGRMIKYITIDNEKPTISIKANSYIEYEMAENGYTNVDSIVVKTYDNNPNNIIMYRVKTGAGTYGEWITHNSTELVVTSEGMYEVKPVDSVGNEGITRHFIIYRQQPVYSVFVGNSVSADTSNQIIKENVRISWSEPEYETEAPIVKVTINGRPYERQSVVSETGEYVFVFVDLAGNTTTHKITINKDPNICLDDVKILPNKQYLFNVSNLKLNGQEGYTFKENDVIIFATPSNYYSGISGCGENLLCYKMLDENSYIILTAAVADYINKNKNVGINLEQEYIDKINELGGFVYAFIVDYEVAEKDLGIKIKENVFSQDPLGWVLIFAAGAGVIYIGLKLFVFRKKVKVL